MASEGFDSERTGGMGSPDPGQAAREAADRIAAQVREILGQAEERAGQIRSRAEADADVIRENAAGAAARLLERVDELEREMESHFSDFFATIRREVEGLSTRDEIEAARAGPRSAVDEETVEFRHTSALDEPRLDASRPQEPQAGPFPQVEPEPRIAEPEPAPATAEPEPQAAEHVPAEPEPAAQAPEPVPEEPRRRRGILRRRRDEDEDAPSREGAAEDAHVMALNMALNGTPREETEEYLVRRFGQIDDLESILDDVYGRVKRR